jgi:glycine oxidase
MPVKGLLLGEHGVHGLMTEQGEFKAERVVIAGGAWSALLLEATGVTLPIRPVRGQMILYRAEPDVVQRIVLSRDRYVIPRRDGRILVGSTLEEVGFDKSTTRAAMQELESEATRLIPALANYPIEHHWAGLRPGSPHGIPYIMQHPRIEGLFINTGHFRNGVVLGLASARLLADILLQRQPILDPAPYAA